MVSGSVLRLDPNATGNHVDALTGTTPDWLSSHIVPGGAPKSSAAARVARAAARSAAHSRPERRAFTLQLPRAYFLGRFSRTRTEIRTGDPSNPNSSRSRRSRNRR